MEVILCFNMKNTTNGRRNKKIIYKINHKEKSKKQDHFCFANETKTFHLEVLIEYDPILSKYKTVTAK